MERNNCVYFLRDPRTGEVGYVGISHQPNVRFRHHWTNCQGSNDAKSMWFNQLKRLGLKAEMQVVFTGLTREQAIRVENGIIQAWVKNGRGKELHQFTKQKLYFRRKEDVLPLLEPRFLQCSPACRRELIEHFQQLTKS